MSPTVPRIRQVSAPTVAMNTHFCHIRAMISSLMLASKPAPLSWSYAAWRRALRVPSWDPIVRLAPGPSMMTSPSSLAVARMTTTPPSTAEALVQRVQVSHPVQERDDQRLRTDRRGEVSDCLVQCRRLYREEDDVRRPGQLPGREQTRSRHLHLGTGVRPGDPQAALA